MSWLRDRRRRRLRATPLSAEWRRYVTRNVPYYRCLPPDKQAELDALIQVFVAEKPFEGAGGLRMTDEIRVTVAAQACILLLGRAHGYYPDLDAVVVYPSIYMSSQERREPDGTVSDSPQARLGESWKQGVLVLSWEDVLLGARDVRDGRNVVFHEFAHQLDAEHGPADGAPALERGSMYASWARVLGKEYTDLVERLKANAPTLLDPYAATNPAEFFAVATEYFFEKPRAMKAHHPGLYEQLSLFYRQDPAAWRCP